MKRVGIASLMHESNTFYPVPTTREMFRDTCLVSGAQVLSHWGEAHHEIGGMLEVVPGLGLETVPLVTGTAMPAGPLREDAYEGILEEILDRIAGESLDGLLLALHGAMVAEHVRDADGRTAAAIRRLVGPDLPIVMTLDLHANVSPLMIESVTATTIYRTYPHLDQRDRGREAARILAQTMEGRIRPVQSLVKPPVCISILAQATGQEPMAGLYRRMEELIEQDGVVSASIAPGFAYADVEEMGPAFLVVTDGDRSLARNEALALARRAWDRRDELTLPGTPIKQAVAEAMAAEAGPVTLLDVGDNVGGGSPADGTLILEEVMRTGSGPALVVLFDPAAVQACAASGVGTEVSLGVGGKSDDLHGPPIPIRGRVRCLHDGAFVEDEPRHGGARFNNQGLTALVEADEGHAVVLTSLRMAPMSLEQVLSLGIRPRAYRILVAKGAIAPVAAYEPVSSRMIYVDTPGITSANPAHFDYRHRPRPLYPFEPETVWEASQ
ncbi:MAG: M81 family metallopeptidase [Candidatus Aminicenantes bacterium]|nr:M81 family metallopeptidase [Candidatus Aminicenantes bacterium]